MVAAMAAAIWFIGTALGTPRRARWIMLGILMACVIAIQLVFPDQHPLRQATGGDARLWVLLLAFCGIIYGYRSLLRRLRRQAQAEGAAPAKAGAFSDTELDRYARHIILREIGGKGQKTLKEASVLVVGAGGLGAPALQYLAAAGVGTIGVIDDDVVDNANLQRQVIHTDARIGMPKVFSAAEAIAAQNPFVCVRPYHRRFAADVVDLFDEYDVVLDGSDNFATRYLVNETAVGKATPLIAAALTQWEGQISVYDPATGSPCYACVFPTAPDSSMVPSCAEAGVIGPLPGVVGAMMAVEAIKLLTGAGATLAGRLHIYDALYAESRTVAIRPRADCAVCQGRGLSVAADTAYSS